MTLEDDRKMAYYDGLYDGEAKGEAKGEARGRQAGLAEGEADGINRMARLTELLMEAQRTDDLLRAAKEEAYREDLFQEFGL